MAMINFKDLNISDDDIHLFLHFFREKFKILKKKRPWLLEKVFEDIGFNELMINTAMKGGYGYRSRWTLKKAYRFREIHTNEGKAGKISRLLVKTFTWPKSSQEEQEKTYERFRQELNEILAASKTDDVLVSSPGIPTPATKKPNSKK